jgi:hypothetical protein
MISEHGWRPIASAPRDGVDVLIWRRSKWDAHLPPIVAGWFQGHDGGWASADQPDQWIEGEAVAWMPLPPPPSDAGDGK